MFKASYVAKLVDGVLIGEDIEIEKPAEITKAGEKEITFLVNPKYEKYVENSSAGCIVTEKGFYEKKGKYTKIKSFIEVSAPYIAMIKILSLWEKKNFFEGISPLAHISKTAKIGKDVVIYPFAFIGENTEIGDNSIIFPGVFIGDGTKIGKGVIIFPSVVIYPGTEIGDNSIIHGGAVIGADGFGYISHFGEILKIPQVGKVVIGKEVEIGANTTIDRATMGETKIGDKTKIDNLVQVAHNVEIGEGARIAAQTGIAGSSKIGDYSVFGGQVGISDHVKVGSFVMAGARSAIINNIKDGEIVMGEPAMERKKFLKIHTIYLNLPEILQRIKKIEEKIK